MLTGAGRNGTIIAENDDIDTDAGNYDSRITIPLPPNDYSIEATTYNPAISGAFTLTVSGSGVAIPTPAPTPTPPPTPPDDCVSSIHFSPQNTRYGIEREFEGGWYDGCLSENRPIDSDRPSDGDYYALYYTFSLSRAAEVTIGLAESDVDGFLYLLEGEGRYGEVLYKNDDYGGSYNPRIEQTLQPGSYTVEATTYDAETAGFYILYAYAKDVDSSDADRDALIAFYNATNGDDWHDNDNWLSDAPLGEWHGVLVDANGRVVRLSLSENGLLGTIPPELGNLSHLEELYLNDNRLEGEIPPELGRLANLGTLSLVGNHLTGEIPPELSGISNPKALFLSHNLLTGEIPPELQYLNSLVYLELDNNRLTGSVPPELGNLANMWSLKLNANELSGELPQSLIELRRLGELRFEDNAGLCAPSNDEFQAWLGSVESVSGEVCAPPPVVDRCVEPISVNGSLSGSWTRDCVSSKRAAAADKPKIGDYYARYYAFSLNARSSTTITLQSAADTYLYLLSGSGRNGTVLRRNDDINTSAGNYNSHIATTLQSGDYTIEATTFAPAVTGSFTLRLDARNVPTPSPADTDRAALVALYNATNGDNWRANTNWLSDAPLGEWHGVDTDGEGRVTHIALGDHNQSGRIPPELGDLRELRFLSLGGNSLMTGSIPPELGKLSNLQVLWLGNNKLTGSIPAELGRLSSLRELSLNDNDLSGLIPAQLGDLSNLEALDIGHNELTGGIPPTLGNLSKLRKLALGSNRLSGKIPSDLGDLENLNHLDIAYNSLSGTIPPELGNLVNLENLILDTNLLSGDVPSELGNLRELQILWLHDNSLTGELPQELTSLKKLRLFFFDANDGLCAPDDAAIQAWLQSISEVSGSDCSVVYGWSHRPVFDGGIDLGVAFIGRLPRYERYKLAYFHSGECEYPYDEFLGAVVCPEQDGIKRLPRAGETVELKAHVWNFGDTASGAFDYRWLYNGTVVSTGRHDGLESGAHAEVSLSVPWPGSGSNPAVTFEIDPGNSIAELLENNNILVDWIKGHTLGFHFTPVAYQSLRMSNEPGQTIQSPEHWVHNNITRLNELLTDAGLEDRVRTELFLISEDRQLWAHHPLRYYMDGWWAIRDNDGFYTPGGYRDRPEIDWGLLHELLHQLGVIDLYRMRPGADRILLPDVNRPGYKAGCGLDYWDYSWNCYEFPDGIGDLMSGSGVRIVGAHTAGGLRSNAGHRRGFYGEYLYDTPQITSVRVLDANGSPLSGVALRFYQYEFQEDVQVVDTIPEFAVTTDTSGIATLPNRGITGIVTATGHQLKPNPFGHIDVVGTNGLFIIEMEGAACTNYEWLTIVDLNLAYWSGQTDSATFDKTLRCPPPSGSGAPSGIPSDAGIEDRLPPPYSPYAQFAPQTDSRSTPAR